ncbi:uncharacterized protein LOC135400021 isoform X2 [Ornithodoros turicata]|uniref:uncharacterized protein LOC135400021 isoform X2 n=1 Tax=Ornithodoros turicata TaxID=34597 RepID=UPI003139B7E3
MSFRKTLWILIAYNVVVEKGSFTSDVLVAYRAGGRTMNEEVSTSSDNVTVTAINEDAPDKLEAPLSPPLHVAQLKTPGEIICDDDLVEENVMPAHKKRPSEQGKLGRRKPKRNWRKECCTRGKKFGSERRVFLSANIFLSCRSKSRLQPKPCASLSFRCCKSMALTKFYLHSRSIGL